MWFFPCQERRNEKKDDVDVIFFRVTRKEAKQVHFKPQCLDSTYVTRYFVVSLKKKKFHKPLRKGVQSKLKHSNKTLGYDDHRSNLRYKDYMEDTTFSRLIPVMNVENLVHTVIFSGRLYPKTSS